jgi:hypothetical protein
VKIAGLTQGYDLHRQKGLEGIFDQEAEIKRPSKAQNGSFPAYFSQGRLSNPLCVETRFDRC